MMFFRETTGHPVEIDPHLEIGAGGEARIYALPTAEDLVAKVYRRPTEERARKLVQMLADPPADPTAGQGHASIAWPIDLLREGEKSGRIVGYLMPRAESARPIMDYYNPAARRVACPLFNYRYLLRTGRNLAAVVAVLHARDYVIGDVNEANILVTATALVTVVDTDSFQVRDKRRETVYRCPVARPEFTPAELQGQLLHYIDRTPVHDRFGLGVLLFLLLMEGTHPFAGVYTGEGDPPPYEARIAAGHFPYGTRPTPYRPLPFAPPVSLLPLQLYQLFRCCFQEGHDDPSARPDAQTWSQALRDAEENLATCDINPQHLYGRHLSECPWCARTLRLGGRDPFPSRAAVEIAQHLLPGAPVQTPLPVAETVRIEPRSPVAMADGRGTGDFLVALVGTTDAPMGIVESKTAPDVPARPPVIHRSAQPRTIGDRRPLAVVGMLGVVVLIAVIVLRAVLPSQQRVNASMHTATGQTPTVQPVQPTQSVIAVSAADRAAATPQKLQRAILSGDEAQVRALLAANPPLAGAVGKKGWTPLHYAAYAGKADIAEMFCTAGADVNAKTEDGSAPLHLAAQEGHAAVTRTLLAHGANVNAQETQGWTPLHFTAQEGHVDVATLLIDGGADINSRDHAGRTPLAVALKVNKLFVVDLLRQRGGQN